MGTVQVFIYLQFVLNAILQELYLFVPSSCVHSIYKLQHKKNDLIAISEIFDDVIMTQIVHIFVI